MADPDEPRTAARGGRSAVLWIAAVTLAAGAAAVLVVSDDVRMLRLALVGALWAGLVAAFAATRMRQRMAADEEREADRQRIYELELEREIAARHEFELEAENEIRRRVAEESGDQIAELRQQLGTLQANLEQIVGGNVMFERVALRAESTRMRPMHDRLEPQQPRMLSSAEGWSRQAAGQLGGTYGHPGYDGAAHPERDADQVPGREHAGHPPGPEDSGYHGFPHGGASYAANHADTGEAPHDNGHRRAVADTGSRRSLRPVGAPAADGPMTDTMAPVPGAADPRAGYTDPPSDVRHLRAVQGNPPDPMRASSRPAVIRSEPANGQRPRTDAGHEWPSDDPAANPSRPGTDSARWVTGGAAAEHSRPSLPRIQAGQDPESVQPVKAQVADGAHAEGKSVTELLAAYGESDGAPRRRRRRG